MKGPWRPVGGRKERIPGRDGKNRTGLFPWGPSTAQGHRSRPGSPGARGQEGGKHIRPATWTAAPAEAAGRGRRGGRSLRAAGGAGGGLAGGPVAHAHTGRGTGSPPPTWPWLR